MTPTERILSQIHEAQKLSEGATPGPWTVGHPDKPAGGIDAPSWPWDWLIMPNEEEDDAKATVQDWAFIAAAREGWPLMARQLEEAVKALEEISRGALRPTRIARETLAEISTEGK